MIRTFLNRYKIDILEAYIAAMMCFTCMSSFGMNWITTAIIIGVANTYLVGPVVKAFKMGNVTNDDILEVNHKVFLRNVGRAIVICTIIVGVYYVVNTYLFFTGVLPITFGILYKLIDNGLYAIGRKIKNKSRI